VQINSGGWLIPEIQEAKTNKTAAKKKKDKFMLVAEHEVIDKVATKLVWMCWLIALSPLPGSLQA
jgi:hypothetical protein